MKERKRACYLRKQKAHIYSGYLVRIHSFFFYLTYKLRMKVKWITQESGCIEVSWTGDQ